MENNRAGVSGKEIIPRGPEGPQAERKQTMKYALVTGCDHGVGLALAAQLAERER